MVVPASDGPVDLAGWRCDSLVLNKPDGNLRSNDNTATDRYEYIDNQTNALFVDAPVTVESSVWWIWQSVE